MRRSLIIGVLGLCMVLPATASAQPSGTVCSTQAGKTGDCMTILPTDHYSVSETLTAGTALLNTASGAVTMQGNGGCVFVYRSKAEWQAAGSPSGSTTCVQVPVTARSHSFDRYLFYVPGQDYAQLLPFSPTDRLLVIEYVAEGKVAGSATYATISKPGAPLGSQLERYCSHFRQLDGGAPTRYAQDATPQDVYDTCRAQMNYYDGRWSERTQATTPEPTRIVVPASASKCASVKAGRSTVAVRSSRFRCNVARNVVVKYARTLKSPAGWTCMAVVTDNARRARCTKKTKGKAAAQSAVFGIWIKR